MNPTDPNTLLPCPFCGGADIDPSYALAEAHGVKTCSPGCMDCGAMTDTLEQWNTRAPSAELTQAQAEAAAMRSALSELRDCIKDDWDSSMCEVFLRATAALSTTAGKDLLEQLRQLSAEREHNANEALAMRAERDEARKELVHLEPLISKCAEAMGFIRLAAICLKLNGPQWSEEPGFTVPMNSALLKLCAEPRNHFPPEPPKTQNHSK